MLRVPSDQQHDVIIVGGGPAGLSAAISVARARRSVLLFDTQRPGRSDWGQMNHSYLGFPDGVSIVDLCARGRKQAERLGVPVIEAMVDAVTADDDGVIVTTSEGQHYGRKLVLATGVSDNWVKFPGYGQYIGNSMHWCITFDGYEMQDQRVVVVGNDREAGELALQLLHFGPRSVTLLTNTESIGLPPGQIDELSEQGIAIVVDRIIDARARVPGYFEAVQLIGGTEMLLDHLFSVQVAHANSSLAGAIGVKLTTDGYIEVDDEARTRAPAVYAAGDVTSLFSHQVLTAAHEGATAAATLTFDLYQVDLKSARARRIRDRGDMARSKPH